MKLHITLTIAFALLFLGFMGYLALRDSRAEDRCEDLGGQTWDSGRHCVIGGLVVTTR